MSDTPAIARSPQNHIAATQEWSVTATGGQVVTLQLAGAGGKSGRINFAQKHLLSPSKKDKPTSEEIKAQKRFSKRTMDRPPGLDGAAGKMSWQSKYGSPNANIPANTTILLSVLDLKTVLLEIAKAILEQFKRNVGKSKIVTVTFSKPCVRSVNAAGWAGDAGRVVKVQVERLGEYSYALVHLES